MTDNAHLDRIAEVIQEASYDYEYQTLDGESPSQHIAKAVIDALNPVIDTVEQLDALPVGAVVIDDMLDVLSRGNADGGWLMAGYEGLHIPVLPACLLWSPSWHIDGEGNQP